MEGEIIDTMRTTSKSPKSPWAPSGDFEGIRAIICDLDAEMYKSLDARSLTWLDSTRSSKFEKKKMITENQFNTAVNNRLEEMIGNDFMELQQDNQANEERLNEFIQKNDEIEKQLQQLSFNHTILSYHYPLFSRSIENLQELSRTVEKDMKDKLTVLENLTEENLRRSQSLEIFQSEMSQRQEVMDDLISKITEEMKQYDVYLEEAQELDRAEAELETSRIMLKNHHQTLVDLETDKANLISLLDDQGKTLENKLVFIKQLPGYLTHNMNVIEEWKAKNQKKMAENEELREKGENVFGKTKNLLDKEVQSKEEKIAESLDSMKMQEVKEANQNLQELVEILSISQKRIEEELKTKMEALKEAKKKSVLIDEKEEELVDLKQTFEFEQFIYERRLEKKRRFTIDSSENDALRSPILGTSNRNNKESP